MEQKNKIFYSVVEMICPNCKNEASERVLEINELSRVEKILFDRPLLKDHLDITFSCRCGFWMHLTVVDGEVISGSVTLLKV